MAIASLVLFFNNSALFTSQTGLKIRRGQSVKLMLFSCKNITTLKEAFQSFVYQLHAKNHDSVGKNEFDKSFVKMVIKRAKSGFLNASKDIS